MDRRKKASSSFAPNSLERRDYSEESGKREEGGTGRQGLNFQKDRRKREEGRPREREGRRKREEGRREKGEEGAAGIHSRLKPAEGRGKKAATSEEGRRPTDASYASGRRQKDEIRFGRRQKVRLLEEGRRPSRRKKAEGRGKKADQSGDVNPSTSVPSKPCAHEPPDPACQTGYLGQFQGRTGFVDSSRTGLPLKRIVPVSRPYLQ